MPDNLSRRPFGSFGENAVKTFFLFCAFVSVVTTIGLVVVLLVQTAGFFREVQLLDFFLGLRWSPKLRPVEFGVLPLISGTLYVTTVTALIALPVGLLTAVYLSEYSGRKMRRILKPALEILAGIPTVVYGYFALVYITPLLRHIVPGIKTFNVLSTSIVVAIMIIPTIASISEDAIRAVPQSLRNAGLSMGVTRYQVTTTIVLPASISGIFSSFILGVSRAIGETMAVTIAGGNLARIVNPFNPARALLEPIQTMTAAMIEIGISDISGNSTAYKSIFAVGFTLFLITLLLNLISHLIKSRYREKYL
jgi:phosphate transport system permease protein